MFEGFFTFANGWGLVVLKVAIILVATFVIAGIARSILKKHFKKTARRLKMDETQFNMVRRIATFMIYFFGILVALAQLPNFESVWVSIFASAGIVAIVAGIAAQPTLSNVFAGIFMTAFRPFRVGDRVKIKDEYGEVEDVTLRHTVLNTWDNRRIIIPNSKMNDEYIINYTINDPRILGYLDLGISYDSDIALAKKIMVEEALAHPDILDAAKGASMDAADEPAFVRVTEFGDFAIRLRLNFWTADQPKFRRMRSDLFEAIKKRFAAEGVEIPYPYHTLVYKSDLPATKQLRPGIDEKQKKLSFEEDKQKKIDF